MINVKYEIEVDSSPNNSNVGDYVYKTIKSNIINWNIKPGVMMSEKELSEKLNVSRTPVREAFIKLSREGLVDILPQRGTVVSRINLKRVEEERFIRESLEIGVLKIAVEDFLPDTIPELEKNLEHQSTCAQEGNYKKFFELDDEFHRLIFSGSKRDMSWDVIQSVNGHYKRLRMMTLWNQENMNELIRQHKEILEGIRSKDLPRAKAASTKHITKHLHKVIGEEDIKEKYAEFFL